MAVLVAAWAPGAARAASSFQVGAAKVDVTPPSTPAAIAAADGSAFALCPPGLDGPRPFAFEEPYKDLNGNGRFDYGDPATGAPQEPYCDANHNGRYDGIFVSSGINQLAAVVHDPIDVRAVAFSDGARTVVLASLHSASGPGARFGVSSSTAAFAGRVYPGSVSGSSPIGWSRSVAARSRRGCCGTSRTSRRSPIPAPRNRQARCD